MVDLEKENSLRRSYIDISRSPRSRLWRLRFQSRAHIAGIGSALIHGTQYPRSSCVITMEKTESPILKPREVIRGSDRIVEEAHMRLKTDRGTVYDLRSKITTTPLVSRVTPFLLLIRCRTKNVSPVIEYDLGMLL